MASVLYCMVCFMSLWSTSKSLQFPDSEHPETKVDPEHPNTCISCSAMTRIMSEIKHMVEERSEEFPTQLFPLPDTPDPREGMSDINFALLPGSSVVGESSIKLSELPWVYQCGIESALRTGSNVTFWYRGFLPGHVHDDITAGKVKLQHHTFQRGTQTGDWWFAHSSNGSLTCPNAEVTASDYIRQDILQRVGGIYMDLDMIILDDRLPHGPDGLPSQNVKGIWNDQKLVGNYLKYSRTTRFSQCMFDTWKLHWNAYLNHRAECAGGCQPPSDPPRDFRDIDNEWGFMGPSLVTNAYLSCRDDNVSLYPPSAFGNDPYPCNLQIVLDDKTTLKGKSYALHTCHELAAAVEDMGANLKRNTTMAHVMQDRCPKTSTRMYSQKAERKEHVAQNLMAFFHTRP